MEKLPLDAKPTSFIVTSFLLSKRHSLKCSKYLSPSTGFFEDVILMITSFFMVEKSFRETQQITIIHIGFSRKLF